MWRENKVQKESHDVSPVNMNEDVHHFVNPIVEDGGARSANPPLPDSYAQKDITAKKKDIGEKGVDEEVHGFVSAYTPPLQNRREEQPYAPNGSHPSSHVEAKKKDIGEKGVDEEVHGFVSAYTPPLQNRREENPYAPNGSDPKSHVEKKNTDIANKEIRPDVWQVVHDIVGPTNGYKRADSPDDEDVQLDPERVHVLQPIAYQYRANTNLPGPRTTFYDKQNGLWRQEQEI